MRKFIAFFTLLVVSFATDDVEVAAAEMPGIHDSPDAVTQLATNTLAFAGINIGINDGASGNLAISEKPHIGKLSANAERALYIEANDDAMAAETNIYARMNDRREELATLDAVPDARKFVPVNDDAMTAETNIYARMNDRREELATLGAVPDARKFVPVTAVSRHYGLA